MSRSAVNIGVVALSALLAVAETDRAAGEPPASEASDPEGRGPFPVGVTTVVFYDHARVDPHTSTAPRALKTEIWYPATDGSRTLPRNCRRRSSRREASPRPQVRRAAAADPRSRSCDARSRSHPLGISE